MNTSNIKWKKLAGSGHSWNPQTPGETRIYTQYLKFEPSAGSGTSGKHYFLREDGTEEWIFDCKMLSDQLTEAVIGSPVRIVFDGKRKAQNGATYKRFDVSVPEAA
jgi:hypothetical protein